MWSIAIYQYNIPKRFNWHKDCGTVYLSLWINTLIWTCRILVTNTKGWVKAWKQTNVYISIPVFKVWNKSFKYAATVFSYCNSVLSKWIKTHDSELWGQRAKRSSKTKHTTVCLLHKRMFSSFDVIITVNISWAASTFKPTLQTQNLLANTNQHPKDKSNQLSSLLFPAWSTSINFVYTFFLTEVASSPF